MIIARANLSFNFARKLLFYSLRKSGLLSFQGQIENQHSDYFMDLSFILSTMLKNYTKNLSSRYSLFSNFLTVNQ